VRILLSAEDSITEGQRQGSELEDTRDYGVRFTKFLATVGRVAMARSRDHRSATLDQVFVVDMTQVGSDGVELGVIDHLRAGEWDKFGFETPRADADSARYEGVSEAAWSAARARAGRSRSRSRAPCPPCFATASGTASRACR
jgi:hypothetical protein